MNNYHYLSDQLPHYVWTTPIINVNSFHNLYKQLSFSYRPIDSMVLCPHASIKNLYPHYSVLGPELQCPLKVKEDLS